MAASQLRTYEASRRFGYCIHESPHRSYEAVNRRNASGRAMTYVAPRPYAQWLAFAGLFACTNCDRNASKIASRTASAPDAPAEIAETDFATPAEALRGLLTSDARVLALGEAHAPKGAVAVSAAKRFGSELLPLLSGRASDLLVELMMPPEGCAAATTEVRETQAPVTTQQAPTNQNEYLEMGERARTLGIVPDMLRPSCADMDAVRDAGDGAVDASLEMIARLSTVQAARLLDRDARSEADRNKLVVVYGGMLHNDLDPPADHQKWSYAPALDQKTGGKVVAVDLVVPEFIVDDETWRKLPWVSYYQAHRARLADRATLFRLGQRSYALVFPETRGD